MKQQMVLEEKESKNKLNTQVLEEINDTKYRYNRAGSEKLVVKTLELKQTSINQMLEVKDDTKTRIFGIYLTFSGEVNGQCVIVIEPEIAYKLMDMIMNNSPGTTRGLNYVAEAVIGEMGNIISSILINEIATTFRTSSQPNPPTVLYDTAEALHDIVSIEMVSENSSMYKLETTLAKGNDKMNGTFLIMLNPDVISLKLSKMSLLRSIT